MSCCIQTSPSCECDNCKEDGKYNEWRVESAFRTLKEAEVIKQDPKMMEKIKGLVDKDKKAITSIAGMKSKIQADLAENEEDD
jgi:hypothetical protein